MRVESPTEEGTADMSYIECTVEESEKTDVSFPSHIEDSSMNIDETPRRHRRETTKQEKGILETLPIHESTLPTNIVDDVLKRLGPGWDERRLKLWYRNNVRRRIKRQQQMDQTST